VLYRLAESAAPPAQIQGVLRPLVSAIHISETDGQRRLIARLLLRVLTFTWRLFRGSVPHGNVSTGPVKDNGW